MNFNYSYRAFLITTLLVGGLYLFMYFSFLPSGETEKNEKEYEIEYLEEEPMEEEKSASIAAEKTKIETHKAFNEAEKFIAELENNRSENSNELDKKLSEIENAIDDSKNDRKPYEKKEKPQLNNTKNQPTSEEALEPFNNKNTTNSYRLINRKAVFFPNPIYTCEGYGKVVLHIEVNALGKVTKAELMKKSSTTSNACLIESAIKYAKKARFSAATKASQMGSITYIFPGQD